jgi:hypothetical protein
MVARQYLRDKRRGEWGRAWDVLIGGHSYPV